MEERLVTIALPYLPPEVWAKVFCHFKTKVQQHHHHKPELNHNKNNDKDNDNNNYLLLTMSLISVYHRPIALSQVNSFTPSSIANTTKAKKVMAYYIRKYSTHFERLNFTKCSRLDESIFKSIPQPKNADISACSIVKHLTLSKNGKITGNIFPSLTNLQFLCLYSCDYVTNSQLSHLPLTCSTLIISNCRQLYPRDLAHLSHLTGLTSLTFDYVLRRRQTLEEETTYPLSNLPSSLISLELRKPASLSFAIAFLKYHSNLQQLRELYLVSTNQVDVGVNWKLYFPGLETVYFKLRQTSEFLADRTNLLRWKQFTYKFRKVLIKSTDFNTSNLEEDYEVEVLEMSADIVSSENNNSSEARRISYSVDFPDNHQIKWKKTRF